MKMKPYLLLIVCSVFLFACGTNESAETMETAMDNPPAEGFNLAGSDEQAIAIADSVMVAMGGRANWDQTRYLHWNFFGSRRLLWDKQEQKARVESLRDSSVYIVDLKTGEGMVKIQGEMLTHPDSMAKFTERGKNMWINDSYWLVMPFKLKDSGVTLKYMGQDTTLAGTMADVLQLTFEGVGVTPNNKYLVYVDPTTHLVNQWDFYTNANDEAPRFSSPWADYQQHGSILLSGNRGQRSITEIAVYEAVPDNAFSTLEPIDLGD